MEKKKKKQIVSQYTGFSALYLVMYFLVRNINGPFYRLHKEREHYMRGCIKENDIRTFQNSHLELRLAVLIQLVL